MTPSPDIGGVKLAIREELLSAEFAAQLDTVAAQYPDDPVDLPLPEHIYRSEKSTIDGRPSVEIIAPASERQNINQGVQDYRHRLVIVWHVLGDDEETVTSQAERYILATRRHFWDRQLLGVVDSAPVICGREDYEPIVREKPEENGPFHRVATIDIDVPTYQQ